MESTVSNGDTNNRPPLQPALSIHECEDDMRNGTKVIKVSFQENGRKKISKKTLLLDEDKTSIRYQPTAKGPTFKNETEEDPLLNYPWLDEAFTKADKDANGGLGFDETINVMRELNMGFDAADVTERFQRFNVEGNTTMKRGKLTKKEFAEFFQDFHYHPTLQRLLEKYSDCSEYLDFQSFKRFMEMEQKARMVVSAIGTLCETANAALQGNATEERIVASAKGVASSTAQLLLASRVKADANSQAQRNLQIAGNNVKRCTDELVDAASDHSNRVMVIEVEVSQRKMKGIRQEREAENEVLRIERELEELRMELAQQRKKNYQRK